LRDQHERCCAEEQADQNTRQEPNPAYLKAGDQITASIASEDGALDLGSQRTMVRDAAG
jgi:hypothetical protein